MGFFKLLSDSFNKLNQENEEDKLIRLEREKTVINQKSIVQNMKCPICGGDKFNKSLLVSDGTCGGSVKKVYSYYDGYNKHYIVDSKMCLYCGYIITMADMNSLNIYHIERKE